MKMREKETETDREAKEIKIEKGEKRPLKLRHERVSKKDRQRKLEKIKYLKTNRRKRK